MSESPTWLETLEKDFNACQQVLIAIGDEVRQSILIALVRSNCTKGMRVGEITSCTHLSRPAISHHLKIMREAGIVRMRKEGTMNFYHINVSAFGPLKKLVNSFPEGE